jgi:hypothetical protein
VIDWGSSGIARARHGAIGPLFRRLSADRPVAAAVVSVLPLPEPPVGSRAVFQRIGPRGPFQETCMKKMRVGKEVVLGALLLTAAFLAPPLVMGQNVKESFTGFAINMNSGPSTAVVDFTIERWSTDAERAQLLSILQEEKDVYRANQKLLTALQKLPKVGYIRTPQTLAWDLHYAYQTELEEGGRRIVLGTDRPIGFREARNQPRTMDYPFTVVEIRLNKADEGEGKILAGTKIFIDKNNNLVLENYGQQPVRFNQIRRQK